MFIVVANRPMHRKGRKGNPHEPEIHDEILIPTNGKLLFQM